MSINYPTLYTSSASPQVILGDNITGQGADDARQGFLKYNNHVHLPFSSTDFFTYNLALGDEVFIYDEDGISVFDEIDAPVIEYLSHTQLRLNTTSSVDLENKLLYVKAPLEDIDNAIVITGVDLVEGSDLVTFNSETPRSGFLTSQQYKLLASNQVNHSFTLVDGSVLASYPLLISVDNASWLKSVSFYLSGGSADFTVKITRAATEDVIESDVISVTGGAVLTEVFTEEVTDELVEVFAGLLTSPLLPNDLVEITVTDMVFPVDVTRVMLVCTLDMLRVL